MTKDMKKAPAAQNNDKSAINLKCYTPSNPVKKGLVLFYHKIQAFALFLNIR